MPKLNFYDTDAVKAFTLDVLVDNAELRRDLDFERRQSAAGWESAREQRTRRRKIGRRDRGRDLHPVEPS